MALSKLLPLLLMFAVLAACNSGTRVPSGVIKLNDMKKLMWDVAQADAYAFQYIQRDTSKNSRQQTIVLYQKVLSLHGITEKQFIQSIKYYQSHPEKHKILLDSLQQYGTRMRDRHQLQKSTKIPATL